MKRTCKVNLLFCQIKKKNLKSWLFSESRLHEIYIHSVSDFWCQKLLKNKCNNNGAAVTKQMF